MQSVSRPTQRAVGAWSGAPALLERWLARRCAVESAVNLASGIAFAIVGLITLAITSCMMAGICYLLMLEGSGILSGFGIPVPLSDRGLFGLLFAVFLGLTVVHAWKTRWKTDSAAGVDLGEALSTFTTLSLEFFSAGPIFLVLAAQDFYCFARLRQLDVPQVSALLLWLYDKGGRARFAEICMAFPKLNAVRVLPQLRDIPGVHWWKEDAEVSLSEDLMETWRNVIGREPKLSRAQATYGGTHSYARSHFQEAVPQVDQEIAGWYATLGLPLFTPFRQVKAQYRKLAKMYHPDARVANSAHGQVYDEEKMKRINDAYHKIEEYSRGHAGAAFAE